MEEEKISPAAQTLLTRVQDPDAEARMAAAHAAGPVGSSAVVPLGRLMGGDDKGVAKAAKEALQRIVAYAGRPDAHAEAHAVASQLALLLGTDHPRAVRAAAAHLLGYVGGDESVSPLAHQLDDPEMREDARLALERIPGSASTRALRTALRTAPPDFRTHLQQSLRHRAGNLVTVGTWPK